MLPASWGAYPADDAGDAIVAALAAGGVEYVFFTSGSEIAFYQEAIAKARALGRPTPKLVTVTHEHVTLNAALGYAAVSGKPAVTGVHVDAGTQHQGGAVHNAFRARLPVLMTAGYPPTSYSGTSAAARNAGGHLWMQQVPDQHALVRQYVKWDHRMQQWDNPGLTVSRALQVARSEPCGPVYLSLPPEVTMQKADGARFPSVEQMGIARAAAPDPDGAREIAARLARAKNPVAIVSGSGRDPRSVSALVELCELFGIAVVHSAYKAYLSFPLDHPLCVGSRDLGDADVVLVLEADIPWIPGKGEPGRDAWIAVVGLDPVTPGIPTMEFAASLRLSSGSLNAIRAIAAEAKALLSAEDRTRIAERTNRIADATRAKRVALEQEATAAVMKSPIDPLYVSQQVAKLVDDDSIVFDDSLPHNRLVEFLPCRKPGSCFHTPGTSGGWAPGAAFGAKLAAPGKEVIAVTGDGFYMFASATAALWSAKHYGAPYLTVVYQNRSWSTGTVRLAGMYPDGYAQKAGFDGGYFDPPMDFAKEAESAGAYGENVREAADLPSALARGKAEVKKGRPAVIAVWLARRLQKD